MEICVFPSCSSTPAPTAIPPGFSRTWTPKLRTHVLNVTKGRYRQGREKPKEDWKVSASMSTNLERRYLHGVTYLEQRRRYPVLRQHVRSFLKGGQGQGHAFLHQRQLHESAPAKPTGPGVRAQVAVQEQVRRSIVELDTRVGRIMDKLRELGWMTTPWCSIPPTTAPGRMSPRRRLTPSAAPRGTVREGGNRVPAIAWMPGKIKPGSRNHDIPAALT